MADNALAFSGVTSGFTVIEPAKKSSHGHCRQIRLCRRKSESPEIITVALKPMFHSTHNL